MTRNTVKGYVDISIHAPREGSDVRGRPAGHGAACISIHAPREGSDGGGFGQAEPF